MNKYGAAVAAAAAFLVGCATNPNSNAQPIPASVSQPVPSDEKLAVVQVGTGQNAELVFCEGGHCPRRTTKHLPSPAPTRAPVAPLPPADPYQVHFRWGWGHLDTAGRREVEAVLQTGAPQRASSIIVAGRTDPTGSLTYNKRLAQQRAETVKAAFVAAGIPANKITAVAQDPCCNGDLRASQKAMQALRRTDISIIFK